MPDADSVDQGVRRGFLAQRHEKRNGEVLTDGAMRQWHLTCHQAGCPP